ncbi:MAG: hypothetical protein M1831_006353 [Alyxoria varia]|nr:MAG: hypothetical protein M1831_006353 [Alyxoria varia]
MSKDWWLPSRHALLSHRIRLLHALNKIPQDPCPNVVDDEWGIDVKHRVLSVRQEQDIGQALAFIAASSDDPHKIVGISIQESDQASVHINLAVNHGHLNVVEKHFEQIGGVLQRVSSSSQLSLLSNLRYHGLTWNKETYSQVDINEVSTAVLLLNEERILCRLRSRHSRPENYFKKEKYGRTQPLVQFAKSYNGIICTHGDSLISTSQETGKLVQSMTSVFDTLETNSYKRSSARALAILQALVDYAFHTERAVASSIAAKPFQDRERYVPQAFKVVKRLARYQKIVHFLLKCATRLSVFQSVRVRQVHLKPSPVQSLGVDAFTESILGKFKARHIPKKDKILTRAVSTGTLPELLFARPPRPFPVHAEIQLLVHHELSDTTAPKPRIISSNKLSCLLCHLFFNAHGEFHTPGTHGRVYEKWALPEALGRFKGAKLQRMRAATNTFVQQLEDRLIGLLENPINLKARPDPAESLVESLRAWSSDTTSLVKNDASISPVAQHSEESRLCNDSHEEATSSASSLESVQISNSPARSTVNASPSVQSDIQERAPAPQRNPSTEWSWPFVELTGTRLSQEAPFAEIRTPKLSLLLSFPDSSLGNSCTSAVERDEASKSSTAEYRVTLWRAQLGSKSTLLPSDVEDLTSLRFGEDKIIMSKDKGTQRHLNLQAGEDVFMLTFNSIS